MQTKFVTKAEKDRAKNEIKQAGDNGVEFFQYPECGLTVAINRPFPEAKCVNVAVSVKSESEKKFRSTVGKAIALGKLKDGKCLTFPANDDFGNIADWLKDTINVANW